MKYKRLEIRLNPKKDNDIIVWLEAQENQTEAIRYACREYIKQQQSQTITLQILHEDLQRIEKRLVSGARIPESGIFSSDEDPELAAALDALGGK